MRSYNRMRSTFWGAGATGRALKAYPESTRLLAIYLFSCDRALAEPWGVYYSPRSSIVEGMGLTAAKVNAGLATLAELHFAYFDTRTEWLWVVNMAAEQVLNDEKRPLSPRDNMSLAANKWYGRCPRNPWLGPWFDRYVTLLHLDGPRRDDGLADTLGRSKLETSAEVQGTLVDVRAPALLTEGRDMPLVPIAKAHSASEERAAEFDKFWAAYHPSGRNSKSRTRDTWMKRKPPFAQVMAGLEKWHQSERWASGFVVDAAKFLNEERWLEDPAPAAPAGISQRTQDVAEALNTGRSIFDLEAMLPGHVQEQPRKLRRG